MYQVVIADKREGQWIMKDDDTLNILRSAYKNIYLRNSTQVWGYQLEEKEEELLQLLLQLCLETDFVREEAKAVIRGDSYRKIADCIEGTNCNTMKSRAIYGIRKIKTFLGYGTLRKLVRGKLSADETEELKRKIIEELSEKDYKSLKTGLLFRLPSGINIKAEKNVSEEVKKHVVKLFKRYGVHGASKQDKAMISDELLCYIEYLENIKDISKLGCLDRMVYEDIMKYGFGISVKDEKNVEKLK